MTSSSARRLAYADPPYPGKSHYYRGHRDFAGEVDHQALIRRLCSDYDGWALSTSAEALAVVLGDVSDCAGTAGFRVAAWHRGERPNPKALYPLSGWEPVIYRPARAVTSIDRRRVDSLVYVARARTTDPGRVIGAKPAAFWPWLFDLLAAAPQDSFDDLFPGSGGGARAWAWWSQPSPDVEPDVSSAGEADVSTLPRGDASPGDLCDVSRPGWIDA